MLARHPVLCTFGVSLALLACTGDPNDPADDAPIDAGVVDIDAPDPEPLPPLGAGAGTLSGAAQPGMFDGVRGLARFSNPVNVISDGAGGVLVADFDNGLIRRVAADGATTTVGTRPDGFTRPFGMVRRGDTVWIQTDRSTAQAPTGALWRLSLSSGQFTLVRDAFGRYRGLGVLSDGRLVGAEYQRHLIALIDPATGVATPLAGSAGQPGLANAVGDAARFDTPLDVVVLPGDVILVGDSGNHVVRKVSLDRSVLTFAGDGAVGVDDGPRETASFTAPYALAPAPQGGIFVAEPDVGLVRHVAMDGAVTTVAGTGVPGFLDHDDARAAQFFGLEGIDLSADGAYLFVADGNRGETGPYHRVRRITLPSP